MNEQFRLAIFAVAAIIIMIIYLQFFGPSSNPSELNNTTNQTQVATAGDSQAATTDIKEDNNANTQAQNAVISQSSALPSDITTIENRAPYFKKPTKDDLVVLKNSDIIVSINKNTGNIYSATVNAIQEGQSDIIFNYNETQDYVNLYTDYAFGYTCAEEVNSVVCSIKTDLGSIIKRYSLDDTGYLLDGSYELTGVLKDNSVLVGPNLGVGFSKTTLGQNTLGPIIASEGSAKKFNIDKYKKDKSLDETSWIGYTSNYFLFAVLSPDSFTKSVVTNYIGGDYSRGYLSSSSEVHNLSIFIGPKSYKLLQGIDKSLVQAINYGWFAFLCIPLNYILAWFYSIFGSYGVAIILLTVLVRLILFPLTWRSSKSMSKMGKLAPDIKEIKEKYGDDSQQVSKKTMELYKKEGVNPLGGCLPILLTIPIFFALYKLLFSSVELYGVPFLWFDNLALKDPYYILPVLMAVFLFINQLIVPTTMDKTQRTIMLVLPVAMTLIFLNFPAGLTLYYAVSNFLTLVQQMVLNKLIHKKG